MEFPFSPYLALLEHCLANRQGIVDDLARRLFGARGKAAAQAGDRESIADVFDACFFESPASARGVSGLNTTLEEAHRADGFEAAPGDGYARGLDPVELVLRACHHWDTTRWPGTGGRLAYTQSLYAVFVLRQLELLSLRIWDEGDEHAAKRLKDVQRLLDLLNGAGRPPQGIRLVRDARWLIQTALGPLTRHVRPYFVKAGHVSRSFTDAERIEIHKAGAVLAGGHLRSQLRHLSWQTGWTFDDLRLLALTRSSNSMDMALLVRDLVPLLDAYGAACARQDQNERLALADAILQGLSADPELLLTRLDLVGPSTAIEDLLLDRGDFSNREWLARYGELIGRTAESLRQDSVALAPGQAAYSPLGIVYGFCADLLSNMVLNTLRSPSSADLSLEDMFISVGRLDDKRIQAHEWERLPRGEGERDPFEHSIAWAAQMHARLAAALEARAARPGEPNASMVRKACLYVVPRGVALDSLPDGVLPAGSVPAQEHCLTSDVARARVTGSTALPADRLSADRAEGRFLASAHADGAWFCVSKIPLTVCLGQGKDAVITDVPPGVVDVLRMVCPLLVVIDAGSNTL